MNMQGLAEIVLKPTKPKIMVWASLIISATMLFLVSAMLFDSRQEAWIGAERQSDNVKNAVLEDVRSQLKLYGTMLDIATGILSGPEFGDLRQDLTSRVMKRMVRDFEVAGVLIVLDREGNSLADSSDRSLRTDNFADRSYFKVHRDRPDAGLFISDPYRSRLRQGDPSFAISRRINDADGNFAGVVVAAIRLAHFRDIFSRIDLGAKGALTLLNSEGIVLMRHPSTDGQGDVGRDISTGPLFRYLESGGSETTVAAGSLDGVERLVSFGHVTDYPVLVTAAIATEDILADWWHQVRVIGGISLPVCASIVLLAAALQRKIDELEQMRAILSRAAATDGLTGLANRREFDTVMRREWLRALRARTSIALLVIDADHFKLVNDRFGHAEGDEVLKELARQISGRLLRAGDFAARYGGEEFAVILPDTDGSGALKVAEAIRAAVMAAGEEAKTVGRAGFTVSIGIVATVPDYAKSAEEMIAAADAALYSAKDAGRNRSILAELTPTTENTVVSLPPNPRVKMS